MLHSNMFKMTQTGKGIAYLYSVDFGEKIIGDDTRAIDAKRTLEQSIRGALEQHIG
jgi:hypothetical protein